jgi:hypothetical protein
MSLFTVQQCRDACATARKSVFSPRDLESTSQLNHQVRCFSKEGQGFRDIMVKIQPPADSPGDVYAEIEGESDAHFQGPLETVVKELNRFLDQMPYLFYQLLDADGGSQQPQQAGDGEVEPGSPRYFSSDSPDFVSGIKESACAKIGWVTAKGQKGVSKVSLDGFSGSRRQAIKEAVRQFRRRNPNLTIVKTDIRGLGESVEPHPGLNHGEYLLKPGLGFGGSIKTLFKLNDSDARYVMKKVVNVFCNDGSQGLDEQTIVNYLNSTYGRQDAHALHQEAANLDGHSDPAAAIGEAAVNHFSNEAVERHVLRWCRRTLRVESAELVVSRLLSEGYNAAS